MYRITFIAILSLASTVQSQLYCTASVTIGDQTVLLRPVETGIGEGAIPLYAVKLPQATAFTVLPDNLETIRGDHTYRYERRGTVYIDSSTYQVTAELPSGCHSLSHSTTASSPAASQAFSWTPASRPTSKAWIHAESASSRKDSSRTGWSVDGHADDNFGSGNTKSVAHGGITAAPPDQPTHAHLAGPDHTRGAINPSAKRSSTEQQQSSFTKSSISSEILPEQKLQTTATVTPVSKSPTRATMDSSSGAIGTESDSRIFSQSSPVSADMRTPSRVSPATTATITTGANIGKIIASMIGLTSLQESKGDVGRTSTSKPLAQTFTNEGSSAHSSLSTTPVGNASEATWLKSLSSSSQLTISDMTSVSTLGDTATVTTQSQMPTTVSNDRISSEVSMATTIGPSPSSRSSQEDTPQSSSGRTELESSRTSSLSTTSSSWRNTQSILISSNQQRSSSSTEAESSRSIIIPVPFPSVSSPDSPPTGSVSGSPTTTSSLGPSPVVPTPDSPLSISNPSPPTASMPGPPPTFSIPGIPSLIPTIVIPSPPPKVPVPSPPPTAPVPSPPLTITARPSADISLSSPSSAEISTAPTTSTSAGCETRTGSVCTQVCSFATNTIGITTSSSCAQPSCLPSLGCSATATTITHTSTSAYSLSPEPPGLFATDGNGLLPTLLRSVQVVIRQPQESSVSPTSMSSTTASSTSASSMGFTLISTIPAPAPTASLAPSQKYIYINNIKNCSTAVARPECNYIWSALELAPGDRNAPRPDRCNDKGIWYGNRTTSQPSFPVEVGPFDLPTYKSCSVRKESETDGGQILCGSMATACTFVKGNARTLCGGATQEMGGNSVCVFVGML
ncbi:hypothetical protein BDZ85DRAFT_131691 [Elsinoe ampelina]|uniref:Uncharacterized protein n=1 Tax=Elsinoe ampelina TaxID=302913 RepID=A0A6A6GAX8_9PEZI|nr:hypothetical protein BDZ85DRAFT_131691 [Elsinoe ampelina]